MPEKAWKLNDTAPVTLGMEFDAPAASGTWTIHDSGPATLAMAFAAPAAEWGATYWGPTLLAFNAAQVGGAAAVPLRMMMGVGL